MEFERKKWRADIPFLVETKDATGDDSLDLKGYASTWAVDRDEEYVEKNAFQNLDEYLGQNPILLWQHDQHKPIGTVTGAKLDDHGLHIKAYVPKPDDGEERWAHTAYSKIKRGIVRTFSIGGVFHKARSGAGKRAIKRVDWYETSVVSIPANPGSLFEAAAKAFSGPLRPELSQKAIEQMEQLIGMRDFYDPDLIDMYEADREERYAEIAEMYLGAGKMAPNYDHWRELSDQMMAAKTPEARLAFGPQVIEVVRQVRGYVSEGPNLLARFDALADAAKALRDEAAKAEDNGGGTEKKRRPPRLREGAEGRSCGSCANFNQGGSCRLYRYPVKSGQVCDSYEASEDGEAKGWSDGVSYQDRMTSIRNALGSHAYVVDLTDKHALIEFYYEGLAYDGDGRHAFVAPYSMDGDMARLGPRQDWREVRQEQEWVEAAAIFEDYKEFNPRQPRDRQGRWTDTGLGGGTAGSPLISGGDSASMSRDPARDSRVREVLRERYPAVFDTDDDAAAAAQAVIEAIDNKPDVAPADRLADLPNMQLHEIASEIRRDWTKPNFAAMPYLDAMGSLGSIDDNYYADSGASVVAYFLSNASSWKGDNARRIKAELKKRLKR